MNNDPLMGISLKLERAEQHIKELSGEIGQFKRLYPNVFGTQLDPKTGRFRHIIRHTGTEVDTSKLSIIAGEVLHQLRSALDHTIARILMKIHAANPDLDSILERSEFPIHTKLVSYQSYDWTKIPGISRETRDAIRDHQPCNRTDGLPPEDHPLAVLASLNNIDKHRFVIHIVNPARVTRIDFGPQFQATSFEITQAVVGSSNVEAPLVEGIATNRIVDMEVHATSEIAFKKVGTRKGEPVIPTLENLANSVRDIVDGFARRFFL